MARLIGVRHGATGDLFATIREKYGVSSGKGTTE